MSECALCIVGMDEDVVFLGCKTSHRDLEHALCEFEWLSENQYVGRAKKWLSEVCVDAGSYVCVVVIHLLEQDDMPVCSCELQDPCGYQCINRAVSVVQSCDE